MPRHLPLPPVRVRWSAAAFVAAAVVLASLAPPSLLRTLGVASAGGGSTAAHLLGYGALAVAVAAALDGPGRRPREVLAGAFLAAVGLGAALEVVQPVVGRTFAVADLLANAAGAALAVALYRAGHRWVRFGAPER